MREYLDLPKGIAESIEKQDSIIGDDTATTKKKFVRKDLWNEDLELRCYVPDAPITYDHAVENLGKIPERREMYYDGCFVGAKLKDTLEFFTKEKEWMLIDDRTIMF